MVERRPSARRVWLEKQGSTTTATYTYGNALLRKDGEYPLFDGLGSARGETNSLQSVTATLTPDAFGQTVATTGSTASKYGFAGLMHVGARYYDPQVGRFTSRDTVLTEHPYLYCEHEPVNYLDPSGHVRRRALSPLLLPPARAAPTNSGCPSSRTVGRGRKRVQRVRLGVDGCARAC